MKFKNGILGISLLTVFGFISGCQKMENPALGDYPKDGQTLPAGDLRFFVPFEGTNSISKWNMADSISKNPAFTNSLSTVAGINGKAYQGADGAAIKYLNANDMTKATSLTIAFWMKRGVNSKTEFYFSLKDDSYGWGHSALFMMVEHGTATAATVKVGVMDQWMEFPDGSQLAKPMLDGNWHHWAITYNETTSKMAYYFDGALVANPPASATDVKNGSAPRGKLDLSKATNVVIGGWNKHVALEGPTDDWVSSFQGNIDQFRMYNKVLSAAEIQALYTGKQ
jgi:hypothetical protein